MTLNMPADILREVTRDDASAGMTHPAPDIDIPAGEDAEQVSGHLRHNAAARREFYSLTRRRWQ